MTPAQVGPGSATLGRRIRWRSRPPFEAAVLSGTVVAHYRRLADRPDRPWVRLGTISDIATGPAQLALVGGVLVARVPEPSGTVCYRRQEGAWIPAPASAWTPPQLPEPPTATELGVPDELLRGVAAFASDWPQALVDVDGSVFSYHRCPDGRWVRSACLRVADGGGREAANSSVKVAQVTGDVDATPTPWGERRGTLSRSESSAGIRGTDLGVRFEHAGRRFLLFGDTHWLRRPWLATRDAIAEVLPGDASPSTAVNDRDRPLRFTTPAERITGHPGLDPGSPVDEPPAEEAEIPAFAGMTAMRSLPLIRFHGSPLHLDRAGMGEYDVPLDAFSRSGRLYALFSSDHFRDRRVMGRSVLARAVDATLPIDPAARRSPVRFTVLTTLSSRHFINVSVQALPAVNIGDRYLGSGEVLLVWGTGPYRASEVRLAMLDAAALDRLDGFSGPVPTAALGVRYWDGADWSTDEADAAPLFRPAAIGELSVRWMAEVGRYALLSASGPEDPIGAAVTLRWADAPWGPWTPPLRLLDWVAGGMSSDPFTRFIKAHPSDDVGDRIFRAQARSTGGAYAPYLFDVRRDGDELVLRYTLSTWNPYQVVLMEHRLVPGEY